MKANKRRKREDETQWAMKKRKKRVNEAVECDKLESRVVTT
jgi:hypothetical protein